MATRIKPPSSCTFCQIVCGLIWYWSESSEGSPLVSVSNSKGAAEMEPRAPPTRSAPRTLSRRVSLQMLQAGLHSCRLRDGSWRRGHHGFYTEVGVVPGVLVNDRFYSALAAELDLLRVRAGQNDKLGLVDEVALGDERISPCRGT